MGLLEDHFDIALSAPSGIEKCRRLILSLAMRGKLIPQDSNDSPACKLLKRNEAAKQRLIKEHKIREPKLLPEIDKESIPYELPSQWVWTQLGDLAAFINGDRGKNYPSKNAYVPEGIPFINAGHLTEGSVDRSEMNYISEERFEILGSGKIISNDILYCLRGSLGKTAVVHGMDKGAIASSLVIIRLYELELVQFVYNYLVSPLGQLMISKYNNGSAQPNLSANSIQKYLFPLPPLEEQRRIVAKINQLMARCDELEKLRAERDRIQITVHKAACDRLLTAKDPDTFTQSWQFITQHFSELYSVKENVTELRKAILQLAVMGKLTAQNSDDTAAIDLLKAIVAEKKKLVKNGKLKNIKSLPPISLEDRLYSLPNGWEWANLQDLLALVTDGDHQAPPKADGGVPFLVIGNLNQGKVVLDNCRFVPLSYYESLNWERRPKSNDILYTVTGSYGIPIFVNSDQDFCVQRHVAILKSVKSSPVEYLIHALKSKYAFDYATSIATGIAQKTVPLTKLRRMPIAVPPVEEQRRIVAKVDQLMSLCDILEQQIDATTQRQTALLNAVIAQV